MKVILREIETVKFVTQTFKLLTVNCLETLFLKLCLPPNKINRRKKGTFEQQFKVNTGKLDQEHCTCTLP